MSSSLYRRLPSGKVQPPWLRGSTYLPCDHAQQPHNSTPAVNLSCSYCLRHAPGCVRTLTVFCQAHAEAAHPSSSAVAAAGDPFADGLGDTPALSEASQSSSDDSETVVGGGTERLTHRCRLPDSTLCRCR